MKAFRSMLYVLWLYGWMAILGLLCLPTLLLPRRYVVACIRFYSRFVVVNGLSLICGIKVELRGLEHVSDGPQLVAGKHQAMLDVFVPFLIYRDPVIVMKRELLWYPILGWYALKNKLIPIDRAGTSKTLKKMLVAAQERVPAVAGRQLIIYPEGTRTLPGAEPDYKPAGIRALYKTLALPLVPMATNSGLCWPARGLVRRPGLVVYEVLPPLPADLPPKQMLVDLQARIETASDALREEGLKAQGR